MSVLSKIVQIAKSLPIDLPPLKELDDGRVRGVIKGGRFIFEYVEPTDVLYLKCRLDIIIPDLDAQEAFKKLCGFVVDGLEEFMYFIEENDYAHFEINASHFLTSKNDKEIIQNFLRFFDYSIRLINTLNDLYAEIAKLEIGEEIVEQELGE